MNTPACLTTCTRSASVVTIRANNTILNESKFLRRFAKTVYYLLDRVYILSIR